MYPLGNCLDRLVSNIQNRNLRWSQLGFSVQQATNAFIYGHIEIQNPRYSKQYVRRAYNKSMSHDPFFLQLLPLMNTISELPFSIYYDLYHAMHIETGCDNIAGQAP